MAINVLEVIRQGQVGGGESHLLDLIAGFDNRVNPIVLSFTGGQMIDALTQRGVKCHVVNTSHPFDVRITRQIKELILRENIQLIHAHGSRAASNVAFIARKLHIPMVYTVHGWSFHQDQSFFIKRLRAWSEKIICKLSKEVICVSESNRITGQKTFGLKHSIVIENGINLTKFNPHREFSNLRNEFGFTDEDFVIGFVGRITLQKAPLDFVKSIALARQKDKRIKALLVGQGDMEEETKEAIRLYGMEKHIRTSPFRSDVPDVLHAIDVFCLPSLWEGLSIALLEAMAMKKALVVTPTDGTKEVITHQQSGLIVDFGKPEELAECYWAYLHHPEWKEDYGVTAMSTIQERFNSRRVSQQVTEVYYDILR
ncbi:glycosyltransferase [Bacteroides caccae]|uniref:glycosyltransferase n=1 Tax=Bacteroides caccae TaxID=47678 RepID=UPI001899A3FC|nr:glycosyltransferase [Bacteroides caccae]